jgi:hypothetical protein
LISKDFPNPAEILSLPGDKKPGFAEISRASTGIFLKKPRAVHSSH